jgi:hypothetical protein
MTSIIPDEPTTNIIILGAHQGARENITHLARIENESTHLTPHVTYVDLYPGRAAQTAERARRMGLQADAVEARAEDYLDTGFPEHTPFFVHLDDPTAVARILRRAVGKPYPVAGDMLLRTPDDQLIGLGFTITEDDDDAKRRVASVFDAISRVTPRRGAAWVVGEHARPEHRAAEETYRIGIGEHARRDLARLIVGLPPESYELELTTNGRNRLPVFVEENAQGWQDPFTLANAFAANPPTAVLRGEEFAIAEIGPDGLRLHLARIRRTDGAVALQGFVGYDPATLAGIDRAERERRERQVAQAIERAQRQTITRRAPMFTTD